MARPPKNNADYFSHDADMRNDERIKAVRRKFGLEGYAIYNMLLEKLTNSNNFVFNYTDLSNELFAGDFEIEPERLREIITYCLQIDLLQQEEFSLAKTPEDEVIDTKTAKNSEFYLFSAKLKERFSLLLTKRKRDRNQKKGFPLTKTPKKKVIASENPQSKVKETKDKRNIKEKYLDFVFLAKEEHKKLIEKFGQSGTVDRIESINTYAHQIGERKFTAKYKSHYHTILAWAAKDRNSQIAKDNQVAI